MLDYAIETVLFARAPGGGLAPPGTRQLARSSRAHKSGVRPVAGVPDTHADTRAPAADLRAVTRVKPYTLVACMKSGACAQRLRMNFTTMSQ